MRWTMEDEINEMDIIIEVNGMDFRFWAQQRCSGGKIM